jgi:hypothetical protein
MCYADFRWGWVLFLAALLAFPVVSLGQDVVSVDKQATFLLKALSNDRNLKTRSSGGIRIAVVYKTDKAAEIDTKKEADEVAEAFKKAGADKVRELPVEATAVVFESVADLLKQVDGKKFNGLYIHSSMASALSSVQQVTRGRKIPSFGSSKQLVEQGASIAVYLANGKPKLVVIK